MTIEEKFQQFQSLHDAAIANIKEYLKPSEINMLVQWMLETDANPFSYLPDAWASSLEDAISFERLIRHIRHAVYDDGDITLVTVNDEPRIVFAHRYDDNFMHMAISYPKAQTRYFDRHPNVQILDIPVNEFGERYDKYFANKIKKYFIREGSRFGIEGALKSYSNYKCFDPCWIALCEQEMKKIESDYGI